MPNLINLDSHFVRAIHDGRERAGITVLHHDTMFEDGDMLLLYELFDGEGSMPSFRVYEKDILSDYGCLSGGEGLSVDQPWLDRLSNGEFEKDIIALLRAMLIGGGSLALEGADAGLMEQLESARRQYGRDPMPWSDDAIDVVRQLSLNEAERARQFIAGRAALAKLLSEQMKQDAAAGAAGAAG